MFNKKINGKLDDINEKLDKSNIVEISYILGNKKEIIKRNLLAGVFRGIGIGIGITIISAKIDKIEYSCYRRLYRRYCFNSSEEFINSILLSNLNTISVLLEIKFFNLHMAIKRTKI